MPLSDVPPSMRQKLLKATAMHEKMKKADREMDQKMLERGASKKTMQFIDNLSVVLGVATLLGGVLGVVWAVWRVGKWVFGINEVEAVKGEEL